MKILNYDFEEPKLLDSTIWNDVAGIYVILNILGSVVDVGETSSFKNRLLTHDRRRCWENNCGKSIFVAALVEKSAVRRLLIESIIRNSFNPTCGKQ